MTSANDISGPGSAASASRNDGGATWSHPTFPITFARPVPAQTDIEIPSGDPILAADTLGNIWAGGLSTCTVGVQEPHLRQPARRLATTDSGRSQRRDPDAGLGRHLQTNAEVIQDKPQMTIDNGPTSPTKGRLYVTWDDPDPSGGDERGDLAYCDTATLASAAFCDNPANWTGPGRHHAIRPAATSPPIPQSGRTARSTSRGGTTPPPMRSRSTVRPGRAWPAACDRSTDWGTDQIVGVAELHRHRRAVRVPTLAQPGGRAAPVPSLAVDTTQAVRTTAASTSAGATSARLARRAAPCRSTTPRAASACRCLIPARTPSTATSPARRTSPP